MRAHPLDEAAPPYIDKALARLREAYGARVVDPAFEEAFRAVPLHRFVGRYAIHTNWYDTARGTAKPHLERIYHDQPIVVRGAPDGSARDRSAVASTLSAPSIVARFLGMLAVQPGHSVLEIGSGSGWLLALLSRYVGPQGRVTGVELLPDLAVESRVRLAAMGCGNVDVVCADAAVGGFDGRQFDRVVVTAAVTDLPRTVFAACRPGARLVAPVAIPHALYRAYGWELRGRVFHAQASTGAWFVPLRGRLDAGDLSWMAWRPELPFADLLGAPPLRVEPMDWPEEDGGPGPQDLCAFLGIALQRVHYWADVDPEDPADQKRATSPATRLFGHYDRRTASVGALRIGGGLEAYGGLAAFEAVQRACRDWERLGRPRIGDFALDIHPADANPPASSTCFPHVHRDSVFVWRLR